MEQSLSSVEKSNPGALKGVSAGAVFCDPYAWGSFKPNENDTYVMIVGPHQDSLYSKFKLNPKYKILFESTKAVNTNYPTWNYKENKRYFYPRNTVVVFEYVPTKKQSSKV